MKTFSFRAECIADANAVIDAINKHDLIPLFSFNPDPELPDVDVELKTGLTQDSVMEIMRLIPDSHVMLQTLRPVPLAENTLERDYDIE